MSSNTTTAAAGYVGLINKQTKERILTTIYGGVSFEQFQKAEPNKPIASQCYPLAVP
jgi:hypothetical protein